MADKFDPYHVWLGIPPQEQPPNLYRLLGLPPFESDLEAIQHAADQRMAYLRTFQTGKNAKLSQKLLNEVAAARVRLLNPDKKAAYDRELRETLEARQAAAGPPPAPLVAETASDTPIDPSGWTGIDPAAEYRSTRVQRKPSPKPLTPAQIVARKRMFSILGIAGGAIAVIFAAVMLFVLVGSSGKAALVFDWPEARQEAVALKIDGKRVDLPSSGSLDYSCAPGEHRISATRPGYRPFEQTIQVESGQQRRVNPNWQSLPNLMLQWPADQRQGANLQIDGQVQDIDAVAQRSAAGGLQFVLKPGPHEITIGRLGYEPFQKTVYVSNGKEEIVTPVLAAMAVAPGPVEPKPAAVAGPAQPAPAVKEPTPAAKETKEPAPKPPAPAAEVVDASDELAAAARYAKAVEAAEKQMAAWDFRGAAAALEKINFDDPNLAARLTIRRDEVRRLTSLKTRIIEKITTANPRLTKSDLSIRGINGELVQADEEAIGAQLGSGKTESYPWSGLEPRAVQKLAAQVADRASADDRVAAALAALMAGDAETAARLFEQAQSLGAKTEPHLTPLAEAALARARELLQKKEFVQAEAALAAIEAAYGKTPWAAWNKKTLAAARAAAKLGVAEADAEKLYATAAELFNDRDLFDLRPIVEKFKTQYASSRVASDPDRTPSIAQMEKAIADLGKMITVAQDGRGQFKTIQEAVTAASPGDMIEILDAGPYREQVTIPKFKEGLMLRGKKGTWPTITSATAEPPFPPVVTVESARVTLQRLVLVQAAPGGSSECLATRNAAVLSIRDSVLAGCGKSETLASAMDNCVVLGGGTVRGPFVGRNCVWLGALHSAQSARFENCLFTFGFDTPLSQCELRGCTVAAAMRISDAATSVIDSIAVSIDSPRAETRIEYCNVFDKKPYSGSAQAGKGCISEEPGFVDPSSFDFHLAPDSPCRKAGSSGGDLGFRYTPRVAEVLKLAIEVRSKGASSKP